MISDENLNLHLGICCYIKNNFLLFLVSIKENLLFKAKIKTTDCKVYRIWRSEMLNNHSIKFGVGEQKSTVTMSPTISKVL